ncbi:protein ECERIFERUM 26-like [Actinidia eriantha]|uniref:protein ECERIFERUM 26-like n=1 Tax=Actinidia eriantha TaxID=165200 RepID=UPI00258653CF|nr:protein ECERIFERUM 26-like [Actinidia eriantha]
MVSSDEQPLVHDIRLSTVGPGRVTGQDVVHEPTNIDQAMKLHYLRGVYYFKSQAVQGLTTPNIKEPMFTWLNNFYHTCGRFRRAESGRPYIKCNDCGARFIEAQCVKTLDEWLQLEKDDGSLRRMLVSNQVVGPELFFSPLVLLQITWFKCGGMSVGLSWAHVLGDAFSAADFMNSLGQVMAGHQLAQPLKLAQSYISAKISPSPPKSKDPLSVKRVGPVGDHWIAANNSKMKAFSFNLTSTQISHLHAKVCGEIGTNQIPFFECLCAVIWKVVAKIRDGPEPQMVTISKNDPHGRKNGVLSNGQLISIVKADFSIMEANPKELAELVLNQAMDERSTIVEAVERDQGLSDLIVYGANLTFVDLEEADFYGLELKAQKPAYVDYTIDGVGDDGVVLLLPGPKDGPKNGGKVVTLTMPEDQVLKLKFELNKEFSIA